VGSVSPELTSGPRLLDVTRACQHGDMDVAAVIAIGIAALSAVAAAVSAIATRQSVDRAHRPFVWPAISHGRDGDATVVRVRLHNDGAGTAYEVRWAFGTLAETQEGEFVEDSQGAAEQASMAIRAVRAGESVPPEDSGWLEKAIQLPPDDIGWILVRWSDAAGTRWEVSDQGPATSRGRPRRLRRWRWQLWRAPADW
jgi:hypothetical protein